MTIPARIGTAPRVAILPWVRRLRASGFLRAVAIVAGGAAAAQLISIAFSPIVTRLYGPHAFGVLAVFTAILTVVTPLSNLTYGIAIVLPASDDEARALVRLSVLIGLAISFLSVIAFAGFHRQIADGLGFTAASAFLLLAPPVILLSAIAQPLRQWLIRKKEFRAISRIAVIESTTAGVSKSAIGMIAATGPMLLVLATLIGALQTLLLWLSARMTLLSANDRTSAVAAVPNWVALKEVAWRYRDFPLFRAPQVWLNTVSRSLPTLMLAAFVGPTAVGYFAIANRVLGLPARCISGAVGTVFLPRITEASHRAENLRPLIVKGTAGLAVAGLLPFGLIIAFGPSLFGLVFGAQWVAAGHYARWLAIVLYFGFINVPSVQAIPVLGLQGQLLVYEIVAGSLRAVSLAFGALVLRSDLAAIAIFSLAGTIMYVWLIAWVIVCSKPPLRSELRPA